MKTEIRRFEDGSVIEQGPGSFDDYCVYLTRPGESTHAPRDTEYFQFFIEVSQKHTPEKVYADYLRIYDKTTANIEETVFDEIDIVSEEYEEEIRLDMNIWLTVIYLGMVAEEKKKYAILKKRIKRLGMYQILLDNMSAGEAANFSRGRKWRELDAIMKEKGI